MKKILLFALLLTCTLLKALTYTTTAVPGVWDQGAEPGTTPGASDDIVINDDWSSFSWSATDARANFTGTLTINSGGYLLLNNSFTNFTGNIDVKSGGIFDINGATSWASGGSINVDGTLSITGDLENNDAVTGSGFINYGSLNGASTGTFDMNLTLPVELSQFYVTKEGSVATLVWQTLSEINNDYFEVQRSIDGKSFETVGIVEGNGNSFIENNYFFIDDLSATETVYYRLKQHDYDGLFEFSHIVTLGGANMQVSINQFGVDNDFFILTDQNDVTFHVNVLTLNGELVFQAQITSQKGGRYNFELPLNSGLFIVNVSGPVTSISEKIYVK